MGYRPAIFRGNSGLQGVVTASLPLGNGADDLPNLQAAANACFGSPSSPHGTNYTLNKNLYIPPGLYTLSAPLQLRSVYGGCIFGGQRFQTTLLNPNGTGVINTNGFQYSSINKLFLYNPGSTGTTLNINWDGVGGSALQSNAFRELYVAGGDIGIDIAHDAMMGSEMSFYDCFISGANSFGVRVHGFNALQNKMFGGNIQSCGIGVYVFSGNMNLYDVGFQISTTWDIQLINSANDCSVITGCRSESDNFFSGDNNRNVLISGCYQTSANSGTFATNAGQITIQNCRTVNGKIISGSMKGKISACDFGRNDWINTDDLANTFLELEEVQYNVSAVTARIQRQRLNASGYFNYTVTAA